LTRALLALGLGALAAGLLLGEHRLEHRAALDGVEGSLVVGEVEAARRALEALPHPLGPSPRRTFLEATLAALSGDVAVALPETPPARVPLALVARAAFDRGETPATLRLAELAEELGRPLPALVTAAALVEEGHDDEARPLLPPHSTTEGRLARSLRQRLAHPPRGRLLRDRHGRPVAGLEDGELRSLPGAEGLLPPALARLELPDASSVRLTLDLELARAARAAFSRRDRGSIVLLDPATGDILAAVSDAQTLAEEGGTPAFEQLREPASISKLITTSAALRSGIDPDAELAAKSCRGHALYGGERLYCPVISGRLRGLDRAMAVSCNVAFADLGLRVGRDGLVDELHRFGFDRPAGAFRGGRILAPRGDERQLADLAIGLDDTELTPLHAALLAATFATGTMPIPNLLHATDGHLGLHPQPLPRSPGRRLLEPEWLPTLRAAMQAVARGGTGRGIAPPGFPVAMKTGTASHPLYGFHVNYIGFGPLPEARIAFAVRITHQRTSRRVRSAARRVSHRLLVGLERIARERGWIVEASDLRPSLPRPAPKRLLEPSPPPRTAR
jgi:peptidoglycan glycosyltransferase